MSSDPSSYSTVSAFLATSMLVTNIISFISKCFQAAIVLCDECWRLATRPSCQAEPSSRMFQPDLLANCCCIYSLNFYYCFYYNYNCYSYQCRTSLNSDIQKSPTAAAALLLTRIISSCFFNSFFIDLCWPLLRSSSPLSLSICVILIPLLLIFRFFFQYLKL